MLQALIFDVDGTLADTEEARRRSFNAAFLEHGLRWQWPAELYAQLLRVAGTVERLTHFVGTLDAAPAERVRLLRLVPEVEGTATRIYQRLVARGECPLRPGVRRLLEAASAAGLRLAIASATHRSNVDALTEASLGTPAQAVFQVIACGDQVQRKKPAPDIYRLALEGLQLAPERCVAFEDSSNGVRSACAAGIATVVCPTQWNAAEDSGSAALRVASFEDVDVATLERLLSHCEVAS
ncbi:MAG: HAD-IA family hydrolase [Burkholderiales bacterium]